MVFAGRRAGNRDSFLPGAPAPDKAGTQTNAGSRGRQRHRVHADSPSRSGPRTGHCFSTPFQTATSRAVRLVRAALPRFLQAKAEEPEIRPASPGLVRTGASRGRLRGDFRRLYEPTFDYAAHFFDIAVTTQD